MQPPQLTPDQQVAADEFFDFLLRDDEKAMVLLGPAGSGKSFLIQHLVSDTLPRAHQTARVLGKRLSIQSLLLTAPTHQAVHVLRDVLPSEVAKTIHSALNLKVQEHQGKTSLAGGSILERTLLFIDEASVIDKHLLKFILDLTHMCKLVFIGDPFQLPPVMSNHSPVFQQGYRTATLTKVIRNQGQQALQDLCAQFRATVDTDVWKPIQAVPGVVDVLSDEEAQEEFTRLFGGEPDPELRTRMLCYTNQQTQNYGTYLRHLRGKTEPYEIDELLVAASPSHYNEGIQGPLIPSGALVRIKEIDLVEQVLHGVRVYPCVLSFPALSRQGNMQVSSYLPVNPRDVAATIKQMFKQTTHKSRTFWEAYTKLKYLPDLRPAEVMTIHKAQGSTFDTVFVDLDDVYKACRNPDTLARIMYVAVSRAKERVIFKGSLKRRFAG